MYLYKRIITINGEYIERTKCFYYNPANSKKKRAVRLCKTSEGKKARNKRTADIKRKYDILNNFSAGDYWITLTHRESIGAEAADKQLMYVIGKVQRALKRKNIPFVYYAKTEAAEDCGKSNVRPHHHLFIKNTSPEIVGLILKHWNTYGNVKDVKEIYNIRDGKLITYFQNPANHKMLTYEKYHHSRNLVSPEIEKRIYPADSFRENPRPPKCEEYGWHYEIANLKNSDPDIDGHIYQFYELVKVKDKE
ncbi:MAG: hypothetical protein LIO53_02075 [Oscillospiraceae bacterium]|nr:hypothetical protein [Oscillospiraceae bacterium]